MIPADAGAPCAGMWTLFESSKYEDHEAAAAICARCHIFDACKAELELARADQAFYYTGTWAGERLTFRGEKYEPTAWEKSARALADYRAKKAAGIAPASISPNLPAALAILAARRGLKLSDLQAHKKKPELVAARRVAFTTCMLLGDSQVGVARAADRRHDTIRHALNTTTPEETAEAELLAEELRRAAA